MDETKASPAEKDARTPAQVVADEYDAYLHSRNLDPAWIAGWHAAINHAAAVLERHALPSRGSDA